MRVSILLSSANQVDPQLKEALEDISKRLAVLESNQQHPIQEQIEEQPNVDNNNINNGVSTQPIDDSLLGSACAKDHLKEFDQIRERLTKVSFPNDLKVNDNSNGIKAESRPYSHTNKNIKYFKNKT